MVAPASPHGDVDAPGRAAPAGTAVRDEPAREPRPGSTLHYALLRVEGEARRRALARLALGRALTDVLLDVIDPGVARTKVHWWHEELDRLHAGEPRHPTAAACRELAGDAAARERLLELLGAAAADRLEPARTVAALDAALGTVGGLRVALVADALAPSSGFLDAPDAVPAGLAVGLARHERLSRLPPLLARRHPVFSAELYARHGLDERALLAGVRLAPVEGEAGVDASASSTPEATERAGTERRALLREAIDLAMDRLEGGLAEAGAARLPVPVRAFATMRLRQLALWRAKGTDLLRERRSLTPLRKAWMASRVR